jgi:hypothetical protein
MIRRAKKMDSLGIEAEPSFMLRENHTVFTAMSSAAEQLVPRRKGGSSQPHSLCPAEQDVRVTQITLAGLHCEE